MFQFLIPQIWSPYMSEISNPQVLELTNINLGLEAKGLKKIVFKETQGQGPSPMTINTATTLDFCSTSLILYPAKSN